MTLHAGAFRSATGQPQVVDGSYIRQWIHMRYKACNFCRYMSESDMSVRISTWTLKPHIQRLLLSLPGLACCSSRTHVLSASAPLFTLYHFLFYC